MSPKNPRPKVLNGGTWQVNTPCGEIYVTVNFKDDRLQEVFFRYKEKSQGSCHSTMANGLGMMTSYALRSGADAPDIIKCLKGHCCERTWAYMDGKPITSCLDAIGKAIEMACVEKFDEEFADQCEVDLPGHEPESEDPDETAEVISFGRAANG